MQYVEGGNSWQQADGSMARKNPDGNIIYTGGQGITSSIGVTKFNLEQTSQNHVNQGIQTSEGLLKSDQRLLSDAKSNTFSDTADFVSNVAQREHSGETIDYSKAGEYAESLQQAVNNVRSLSEKYGYGWQQATRTALTASASFSSPLQGLTGVGISSNVEGSISGQNSSDQSFGEENDISRQNNTNESYVNIVKAASSEAWGKDNSTEKHYSDAVRSSYEQQQRLEEQVSMRQETVDNWHQAKTKLASESATVSKDMYQEVLDRCVIEFGMDANSTRKLVDQGHPDVMRVWNKIADEKLQNLIPEINRGKQQVSGAKAERALNDFTDKHDGLINKNPRLQIKESAAKSGLNIDNEQCTANIHEKEGILKGKFEKVTGKNTEQYHNVRQASEIEQKDLQTQVNKYEKDRIGQGKFIGGPLGIGGPTKGSEKTTQLNNKGAYQNAKQVKPKDE